MTETQRLATFEANARALMTMHGVGRLEFAFSRSKKIIAQCHGISIGGTGIAKGIRFSRHWALALPNEDAHEVMLHEIAHAIVMQNPNENHGPNFKRVVRSLGGKAVNACYVPPVQLNDHPVTASCPKCGKTGLQPSYRLPLRVYFHRGCVKVGDTPNAMVWHKNGVRVPLDAMPDRYQHELRTGKVLRKPKARTYRTLDDYFQF